MVFFFFFKCSLGGIWDPHLQTWTSKLSTMSTAHLSAYFSRTNYKHFKQSALIASLFAKYCCLPSKFQLCQSTWFTNRFLPSAGPWMPGHRGLSLMKEFTGWKGKMPWELPDRLSLVTKRVGSFSCWADEWSEVQDELHPQVLPESDLKFPELNRFLLISVDFTLVFQVIVYSNHATLPTPGFISLKKPKSSDILKYLQHSLSKNIYWGDR